MFVYLFSFLLIGISLLLLIISIVKFFKKNHIKTKNISSCIKVEFYDDKIPEEFKALKNNYEFDIVCSKDIDTRSSVRYHNSMYYDKQSYEKYKKAVLNEDLSFLKERFQ